MATLPGGAAFQTWVIRHTSAWQAGHRAAKGQENDDGRNLYRADNTAWLGGLRMSSTGDTNDATQSMIIWVSKKHDPTRFLDIVWRDWEDYCCCYSFRRKLCKIRHVTLWIQIYKLFDAIFAQPGSQCLSSSLFPTLFGWESDQLISITTEVMISPDGKVFYHRKDAEKHWGQVGRDSSCECDMTMGTWDASWLSEERNLNCIVNTHVMLTYISMPFRMSVYIIIDVYIYIHILLHYILMICSCNHS